MISEIHLTRNDFNRVRSHLLREDDPREFAAFLFASYELDESRINFHVTDLWLIDADEMDDHDFAHLSVTEKVFASVIADAHRTGLAVIEAHSHPGPWAAAFSSYDIAGLRETVPHMWWRLRGRPYAALVLTEREIDGLAWPLNPHDPVPISTLVIEGSVLATSQRTAWSTLA